MSSLVASDQTTQGTLIGVDVGQRREPSAICVTEADLHDSAWHFSARFLERLPHGTPYPQVAARAAEIVEKVAPRSQIRPNVYVDVTGIGDSVSGLLDEKVDRGIVTSVYFNHGDQRTAESGKVTLGKAWLVARLQTLLQAGRLHLPATAETRLLAEELLDYEIKVDEKGNERYGAFRVGKRDELVTAMGLSVQGAPWPRHVFLPVTLRTIYHD